MTGEKIDKSWKAVLPNYQGLEEEIEVTKFLELLYLKKEKIPEVSVIPGTSYVLYKKDGQKWHTERMTKIQSREILKKMDEEERLEFDEKRIKKDFGEDGFKRWKEISHRLWEEEQEDLKKQSERFWQEDLKKDLQ